MLAVEAMLGASLVRVPSDEERFKIILAMATLILVVIVCVTLISLFKPSVLGGDNPSLSYGNTRAHTEERPPLLPEQKQELVQEHKPLIIDAEKPQLSPDDQARRLQQLRAVIYQASRYSTPTYFLDAHLTVIHWNIAFEILFRPILAKIRRRHVNFFIAELANYSAVFDHARAFTENVRRGKLPLVDREALVYESKDYGTVELEKIAAQLTDAEGTLKAWSVALLLKRIDWDIYLVELEQRLRDDKLWGIYAISYDAVLSGFVPYGELVKEVLAGIPPEASHVLELGSGTGNVTRVLLQRGFWVTAVENNTSMLEKLSEKKLQLTGRLTVLVESLDNTEFGDRENFDAAVAVNVAYALEDPAGCFRKVARSLKTGGIFVLSTTYSETSLDSLLQSIGDSLRAEGTFRQKEEHYRNVVAVNKDIEQTLARRYSREQYRTWLEEAGLHVVYDELSYLGAVVVMHAQKVS